MKIAEAKKFSALLCTKIFMKFTQSAHLNSDDEKEKKIWNENKLFMVSKDYEAKERRLLKCRNVHVDIIKMKLSRYGSHNSIHSELMVLFWGVELSESSEW